MRTDGEDGGSADHLSSQQLTAPIEYIINYENNVINSLEASEDNIVDGGDNTEASESEMEGEVNATVIQHSGLCAHLPPDVGNKWLKADLQPKQFPGSPEQRCMTQLLTPLGLFNAFFDDEIVNNMVQMTNLYAQRDKAKHVDNFFTSLRLLHFLHDNNIKAKGVIRSNKLSKCPIKAPKSLEKKERGLFDQRSDSSGKLTVVGWNDNRSVYVTSNAVGTNPTASVSRSYRKSNSRISVSHPYMIKMYNRRMGGVDRCDQNISTYRISIRSKKWWWALFAWIPDTVMQN